MTKLLGFIHRLKRTVKYHTSERRHSLRNKLTDSNSSNGRTIINSTEIFLLNSFVHMAILKDLTACSKYEPPFYSIINSSTIKHNVQTTQDKVGCEILSIYKGSKSETFSNMKSVI